MAHNRNPLVTIVTATRNRRNLLERLIRSVMAQSYAPIEHVVVDGLSSDSTQELLGSYEKKYNLRWVSEKDKNQVQAINKGLRMARGEFVTVTHDDDYWLSHGIQELMDVFREHQNFDIVYGDSWGEYTDGRRARRSYREYSLDDMVNRGYQIPQDGSIFKQAWLQKVGYLDENFEYVPEYELFLRIIQRGGTVGYVSKVTSVGGLHEAKKSWTGVERSWKETWRVNRAHGGAFFSPFTILYLKNRYFGGVASWLKRIFPGVFRFVRKAAKFPEY